MDGLCQGKLRYQRVLCFSPNWFKFITSPSRVGGLSCNRASGIPPFSIIRLTLPLNKSLFCAVDKKEALPKCQSVGRAFTFLVQFWGEFLRMVLGLVFMIPNRSWYFFNSTASINLWFSRDSIFRSWSSAVHLVAMVNVSWSISIIVRRDRAASALNISQSA